MPDPGQDRAAAQAAFQALVGQSLNPRNTTAAPKVPVTPVKTRTRTWNEFADQTLLQIGLLSPSDYDTRHPLSEDDKNTPVSISATQESDGQRFLSAADATIHHYSPAAMAARALARTLPATEDYSGLPGADNSPAALAHRASARVTATEKAYRDHAAARSIDDPAWRPGDGIVNNLAREASDFSGNVVGGIVSDPLSAVVPGEGALARVGGQMGIGAVSDALTQGEEISEGIRDNYNPLQTVQAGVGGGIFGGAAEAARHIPWSRLWKSETPVEPAPAATPEVSPVPEATVPSTSPVPEGPQPLATAVPAQPEPVAPVVESSTPPVQPAEPIQDSPTAAGQGGLEESPSPAPEALPTAPSETPAVNQPSVPPEPAPAEHAPEKTEPQPLNPSEPPVNHEDVVNRMTDALNNAGKLNAAQKALYTAERSDRLAAAREAGNSTSGEEGFHAELAQLKGEMPKIDFEGVRDQFSQPEIDSLFNQIKIHPALSGYEPIAARSGLKKLLDGQVPTPSEIDLLSKVFPKDFIKAALDNRSFMKRIMSAAENAGNLPRALMATADLSAPLRQGVFLVGRKEFYTALPSMFKEFKDAFVKNDALADEHPDRNWKSSGSAVLDEIRSRPTYDLMERSKLALTNPEGFALSNHEEAFMSQWAGHMPGNNIASKAYNTTAGRVVRASEAAYSGFLNKLRADTFDSLVSLSDKAGIDFKDNPKALKDIASFVNNATGRGSLGALNKAGPILNGLFFSPRLMASRLTMLNPAYYIGLSPVVRKEAVKSLLSFGGIAATVLGLAAAGGASVETNPRSSDFAKIRDGNVRYDILGGFGQYITLGTRLATNETKTGKGEVQPMGQKFGQSNRLDATYSFLTSKESPVASFVSDYLRSKDAVGNPFEVKREIASRFIPLFAQDVASVMQEKGPIGAVTSVPGAFGVGIQVYDPWKIRAPQTFKLGDNTVTLTEKNRDDYESAANQYFKMTRKAVEGLKTFNKIPADGQRQILNQLQTEARGWAKDQVFPPVEGDKSDASTPQTGNPALADQIRKYFPGVPTDMRRTELGNKLVGGVPNSYHKDGDAIDFVPPKGMTMGQLYSQARTFFPEAKVLNEGSHVHVQQRGMNLPYYGDKGIR